MGNKPTITIFWKTLFDIWVLSVAHIPSVDMGEVGLTIYSVGQWDSEQLSCDHFQPIPLLLQKNIVELFWFQYDINSTTFCIAPSLVIYCFHMKYFCYHTFPVLVLPAQHFNGSEQNELHNITM